jgi:hypothetical protein
MHEEVTIDFGGSKRPFRASRRAARTSAYTSLEDTTRSASSQRRDAARLDGSSMTIGTNAEVSKQTINGAVQRLSR